MYPARQHLARHNQGVCTLLAPREHTHRLSAYSLSGYYSSNVEATPAPTCEISSPDLYLNFPKEQPRVQRARPALSDEQEQCFVPRAAQAHAVLELRSRSHLCLVLFAHQEHMQRLHPALALRARQVRMQCGVKTPEGNPLLPVHDKV